MTSHIHQEQTFAASPDEIYAALTQETEFTAMTGAPVADRSGTGRRVRALRRHDPRPEYRVPAGSAARPGMAGQELGGRVHSVVRFALTPEGETTRIVLDHAGYPDGTGEHLEAGWHPNYWEPLARRFP